MKNRVVAEKLAKNHALFFKDGKKVAVEEICFFIDALQAFEVCSEQN